MSALISATENLILAARKAASRLSGTVIMGQKLDRPLADELGVAITGAQHAIEDERERLMKDEQRRAGIRDLARQVRQA